MSSPRYQHLTDDQVDHFMKHGYVRLSNVFTKEQAKEWTKDVWTRLGMDPNDQSTWGDRERINMPRHRNLDVAEFAPSAWGAICDLLGGADRIDPSASTWSDAFIVNLGKPEYVTEKTPTGHQLDGWHCDGDFFLHFLDSPEQALLIVPLWDDIKPRAGGTYIAPQSIEMIAKAMNDQRKGIMPKEFDFKGIRDNCTEFVELSGNVGDVILMHPLMLHSASHNNLRIPRIITNPPVGLKSPFVFKRSDPAEYSLVELKTLQSLGVDPAQGLDYKIEAERKEVVPERVLRWKREKELEEARLTGRSVPGVIA